MILKIIKMIGIGIGLLIISLLLVGIVFENFSPEFGGNPTKEQQKEYEKTGHFKDGKFVNLTKTEMDMSLGNLYTMTKEFITGVPNDRPSNELPVLKIDSTEIANFNKGNRLIWFGHSAFLLQLDQKNILIDPMLGDVPAPHPWLGGKRYSKQLPIEIEQLPKIDAILISHDHYDHLDYGSIQKLKSKTDQFLVPLGVGAHLKAWDIEADRIEEFDWWQETSFSGLKLAFTPARHFSGRGLNNRASTLWGSWVIIGDEDSLYFSGDSGYGNHFKEIGSKFGPFDFAMMECGQYDEKWHNIHMMPEETAQAAIDVKAKIAMPIHWGAFTLALHSWTDPAERLSKKAQELGQSIIIPKIGESIQLKELKVENSNWWQNN